MKELEERIAQQGTVKPGNVLKVDAFLNHQCDVELFDHMGAAWAEHFKGKTIDKILTIEASGIAIAAFVASKTRKELDTLAEARDIPLLTLR